MPLPFPTPTSTPAVHPVGWIRINDEDVRDAPGAVVITGERVGTHLLVVGGDQGGPVVWSTSDGREWSRASLPGNRADLVRAAAGNGERSVAVGGAETTSTNRVWLMADGRWREVLVPPAVMPDATAIRDITWTGMSFVAVGSTQGNRARWIPAVWSSRDGVVWQRELLPSRGGLTGEFVTAAVLGGTVIAAGSGQTLAARDAIVVRRDRDGSWDWVEDPKFATADDEEISRLASTGWVAVAVGTTRDAGCRTDVCVGGEARSWISLDGHNWTPVQETDPPVVVAADDRGFLGVRAEPLGYKVFTSADALEWREQTPRLPPDTPPVVVARIGDGVVALLAQERELAIWYTQ